MRHLRFGGEPVRNGHARLDPAPRRATLRGARHPPDPHPPTTMPWNPPHLETPQVIVRLARTEDVPQIVRYFDENRERLAPSRPLVGPEFFTQGFWNAQVHANLAEFREGRSVRLFIFDRAMPERVVGNANFTQIFRAPAHTRGAG
jgi:RimJ/RimL family protein N-acetyltransferase